MTSQANSIEAVRWDNWRVRIIDFGTDRAEPSSDSPEPSSSSTGWHGASRRQCSTGNASSPVLGVEPFTLYQRSKLRAQQTGDPTSWSTVSESGRSHCMTRSRCQSKPDVTPYKSAMVDTRAGFRPSTRPRAESPPSDAGGRGLSRSFSCRSLCQAWRSQPRLLVMPRP